MGLNKISLLKSIDRTIGRGFLTIIPRILKPGGNDSKIQKILIIRPGGIGDAVLLLPSLRILKQLFPLSVIDILAEKRNQEIFSFSKEIRRAYCYDRGVELLKCLKNKYDLVIDTEQWHRLSGIVAYLTRASLRVGFDTNERRKVFTNPVQYSHDDYEVYSFIHLIEDVIKSLNIQIPEGIFYFNPETPFIEIDNLTVESWVTNLVNEYIKKYERGFVVISPRATVRERRWGGEKYGEVARRLLINKFGVIVIGTITDRADSEVITGKAKDAIDLTGRTGLKEIVYILKKARLFIGPDSGVLHIAAGIGTPTVSLFGSGIQKKWAPKGKNHIVINKNLPCSPCTKFGYTPECKNNISCLSTISPDEVWSSSMNLLKRFSG